MWDKIKKNSHYYLFLALGVIGIIQLWIWIFVTNGKCMDDFLFFNPTDPLSDMFMDLFNPLKCIYMSNPYTQINAMYPPINYILLFVFFNGVPKENINSSIESYVGVDYNILLDTRNNREAVMLYLIYTIIFSVLIIKMINILLTKKSIKHQWLYDILFILSWGYLYNLDRANFLLPVIFFILFYFAFEDSSNAIIRELSLLSLALGICMKLYPVLLSVYILSKKEYKKFIRLTLYCILIFFLPFIFYGGKDAIIAIIKNVFSESVRLAALYPGGNINASAQINVFRILTSKYNIYLMFLEKYIGFIVLILGTFFSFFVEKKWKKIFLLTLTFILFPGSSMAYNLIYLIVPFTLFIVEPSKSKYDYIYVFLYIITCFPIPYVIYDLRNNMGLYDGPSMTLGFVLVCMAITIMFTLLSFEGLINLFKKIRFHKYKINTK